jgi:hexokinase
MISGAYLGPLCGATIQAAARAGLFSSQAAGKLEQLAQTETKEIGEFLTSGGKTGGALAGAMAGDDDTAIACALIDALIERAARLTAANLSSGVIKSGKGADAARPVCIVAEGTTFYKLADLKARVERYLDEYLVGTRQRHYAIVSVDNATLLGAAIAGLTN